MQKLDDILLKKGDIVDYSINISNLNCTTVIYNEQTINHFQKFFNCKITKIQRPRELEIIYAVPKPILNKKEKRYLENVLTPFRNEVQAVSKHSFGYNYDEYISIGLINDVIALPIFKKNTMYRGMELDKKYSVKELGLFKE